MALEQTNENLRPEMDSNKNMGPLVGKRIQKCNLERTKNFEKWELKVLDPLEEVSPDREGKQKEKALG